MSENLIKTRVKQLLESRNYSVSMFAKDANMDRQSVNNQINRTATLTAETILAVLTIFPDVSAEWLLRGTGSMVAQHGDTINIDASGDHITAGNNSTAVGGTNNTIHNGAAELSIKDAIIAAKDSVIAGKDELIASQKETISLLKEKIELLQK